jgi:hypothetical protein
MARDYAAEYARRIAAGRVIRSGPAKGRSVAEAGRQVARGHRIVAPIPHLPALGRLGRRATPAEIEARAAQLIRRRQVRHIEAIRRQVETGEHAVYGSRTRETQPGAVTDFLWRHYPGTTAGMRRMERDIAKLPSETIVQVVAFGDLTEGYGSDWRGTRDQWRTIGTGMAEGPAAGVGGAVIYPKWDTHALAYGGPRTPAYSGPFETVRIFELRIYA